MYIGGFEMESGMIEEYLNLWVMDFYEKCASEEYGVVGVAG